MNPLPTEAHSEKRDLSLEYKLIPYGVFSSAREPIMIWDEHFGGPWMNDPAILLFEGIDEPKNDPVELVHELGEYEFYHNEFCHKELGVLSSRVFRLHTALGKCSVYFFTDIDEQKGKQEKAKNRGLNVGDLTLNDIDYVAIHELGKEYRWEISKISKALGKFANYMLAAVLGTMKLYTGEKCIQGFKAQASKAARTKRYFDKFGYLALWEAREAVEQADIMKRTQLEGITFELLQNHKHASDLHLARSSLKYLETDELIELYRILKGDSEFATFSLLGAIADCLEKQVSEN
jgi:hypothetical protein